MKTFRWTPVILAGLLAMSGMTTQPVTAQQQTTQPVVDTASNELEALVLEMELEIESLKTTVSNQTTRIQSGVEWRKNLQSKTYARNRTIRLLQLSGQSLAEQDLLWVAGYLSNGGTSQAAFTDIILPCESGGELDPHNAVGPTDDWGRAQVNRRYWKSDFEAQTGMSFEVGILDPALNGYMAARIEQIQGLVAWSCAKSNGINSGPTVRDYQCFSEYDYVGLRCSVVE